MSTGRIAMRSPRYRSYKVSTYQDHQGMCNVQSKDDDYWSDDQRETAKAQGGDPTPYRHHDRVHHCAHGIIDYLEEAVRGVSREAAEQEPSYYEPKQYVECVVSHLRE